MAGDKAQKSFGATLSSTNAASTSSYKGRCRRIFEVNQILRHYIKVITDGRISNAENSRFPHPQEKPNLTTNKEMVVWPDHFSAVLRFPLHKDVVDKTCPLYIRNLVNEKALKAAELIVDHESTITWANIKLSCSVLRTALIRTSALAQLSDQARKRYGAYQHWLVAKKEARESSSQLNKALECKEHYKKKYNEAKAKGKDREREVLKDRRQAFAKRTLAEKERAVREARLQVMSSTSMHFIVPLSLRTLLYDIAHCSFGCFASRALHSSGCSAVRALYLSSISKCL
ncbi:hypothetical protein CRG98_027800 [Punica granatum]|uniref:Uncharacterized protein n=1 Tax=Punica granatum TaxID=22663 RepID=A0A2I0J6D6_PUNGR|nr:hypothetical protein CRG98_027800 [Punica granatum]